jgi:hypothetical protein
MDPTMDDENSSDGEEEGSPKDSAFRNKAKVDEGNSQPECYSADVSGKT